MTGAGELRARVAIQAATLTQRTTGSQTRTWATVATVWARMQPVQGRGQEVERAGAVQAPQTYLVVIRYRSNVTTANRLLWGTIPLNIRSVTNRDERRAELTLEVESGVVA